MTRTFMILAVLLILNPYSSFAEDPAEKGSCEVCGMYTHEYGDTAVKLVHQNGSHRKTCGVACMLRIVEDEGGPGAFASIKVHGWRHKGYTEAEAAYYVIGSEVIPDMIPNIIAFETRADAEAFQREKGGEVIDFTQALNIISPMGMTMPTRIKPAVLPPKGAFGVGVGYMTMVMDEVKVGSDGEDPKDFVRTPGQMMGPKEMSARGEMLMANYGVTDNLTLSLSAAYLEKEMEMYQMGGSRTKTTRHSGMGDSELTLRYSLEKDKRYRNFLSFLGGVTIPTGDFDREFINMPGLQLGTDAFGFTGGLLFSHRYKHLWFHVLTSYQVKLENDDDYKFGNEARVGAAVHYTPNYDLMLGLELDGIDRAKNELKDSKIGNTGGMRTALTAIVDWRFLTALGGNFSVRVSAGIPLYEDLNHEQVGMRENVQLGGGYFGNIMINFKRRFPVM
ncbi:MAG: nitrous oxide reductase accessory protein NosL [bacterium]|nr:nitrous oxide reductase accessory protein NosL [bacterium]